MLFFSSILITGLATWSLLALVLLRFLSGSFLAAMGDACGGIFAAGHGFLAASRWNYLWAAIAAAVFFSQLGFLFGGGTKLLRLTHRLKRLGRSSSQQCPALPLINGEPWAAKVFVSPSLALEAHTVGLLFPKIVISQGLSTALSSQQLKAVVFHEEAHRRGRDNFIIAWAKAMKLTLFYLPGPRLAFRDMCSALEMAADRQAAKTVGGPLEVASALAAVASLSLRRSQLKHATAINGNDLGGRLQDLIADHDSNGKRRCWRGLAIASLVSLAIIGTFATSALAVTGSDQRHAFICFAEHQNNPGSDDVCDVALGE